MAYQNEMVDFDDLSTARFCRTTSFREHTFFSIWITIELLSFNDSKIVRGRPNCSLKVRNDWFSFQVDVSCKKQMKEFYLTTMKPQVDLFSFVFWRKLKTPKRHFEIIWPLACFYILRKSIRINGFHFFTIEHFWIYAGILQLLLERWIISSKGVHPNYHSKPFFFVTAPSIFCVGLDFLPIS